MKELTTEEFFRMAAAVHTMPHEDLKARFLELVNLFTEREKQFQQILAHKWGMASCPFDTPIPDENLELELLRSYRSAGEMLLNSLIDDAINEKMASSARAAYVRSAEAANPDIPTAPYHYLAERNKEHIRAMVRGAIAVIVRDFPAANMRSVNEELKKLGVSNEP